MIGKMETLDEDVKYLASLFPQLNAFYDTGKKSNSARTKTSEKQYLSQLSTTQVKKICDLYKWDFQMFDYDCQSSFI